MIGKKLVNLTHVTIIYTEMMDKAELLKEHLSLAEVIALEYFNIPMADFKEATSEAYLALNRAVKSFDPSKGEFTPYAARSIRNALNTLYAKQLRMAKLFPKSLDTSTHRKNAAGFGSSSAKSLRSRVADSRQDVRREVALRETNSILEEVMNTLSPRERHVVEKIRLGFSLAEIGEKMGITKQAVHKVSVPALSKIKLQLERMGFSGLDSAGLLRKFSSSHPPRG